MKRPILKTLLFSAFFTVAFLGVRVSQRTVGVLNEQASVTTIELGQQAQAYCNEAIFSAEKNDGQCVGEFNNPDSRCLQAAVKYDCVR